MIKTVIYISLEKEMDSFPQILTNLNLSDTSIRITVVEDVGVFEFNFIPMETTTGFQVNSTHYMTGMGVGLLRNMQIFLNFKIATIKVANTFFPATQEDENQHLGEDSDEQSTAVSYIFAKRESDITFGYLFILPPRLAIANPLIPLMEEAFTFYFRQPDVLNFENPFDDQFSKGVAMSYLGILAFAGILLAVCSNLTYAHELKYKVAVAGSQIWEGLLNGLHDAWMWVMGTWAQQGPQLKLSLWQAKFIMNLVNYLSIFLYAIYCALIIASLTKREAQVKGVGDLFRFRYTIFAYNDARNTLFIRNETSLLWRPEPFKVKIKDGLTDYYNGRKESIERIFTHRHAHLDTSDLFYPDLIKTPSFKERCKRLSELLYKRGSIKSGMFVRKGFPFRNEFNVAIVRFHETGVNQRLTDNYYKIRKMGSCVTNQRKVYQDNLGMQQVATMFSSLAVWFGISLIILGLEKIISYGESRRRQIKSSNSESKNDFVIKT